MAALSNLNWDIRWKTRDCEVDGRYGYFHMWEQYSDINVFGGTSAQVYGIVEFAEGIERVDPSKIKFIDQEHAELVMVNKFRKELMEGQNNG